MLQHKHPLYGTWSAMKRRCYNPNCRQYKWYGGRGITVCERWRTSFANFVLDMEQRPEGSTIERIDTNGDYKPSNCRWATPKEQMNNTRANRILAYQGRSQTLQQWADELRVPADRIAARLRLGMSAEKALAHRGRMSEGALHSYGGKTLTVSGWERELGIKRGTLWARINTYGMSFEKAIAQSGLQRR